MAPMLVTQHIGSNLTALVNNLTWSTRNAKRKRATDRVGGLMPSRVVDNNQLAEEIREAVLEGV